MDRGGGRAQPSLLMSLTVAEMALALGKSLLLQVTLGAGCLIQVASEVASLFVFGLSYIKAEEALKN